MISKRDHQNFSEHFSVIFTIWKKIGESTEQTLRWVNKSSILTIRNFSDTSVTFFVNNTSIFFPLSFVYWNIRKSVPLTLTFSLPLGNSECEIYLNIRFVSWFGSSGIKIFLYNCQTDKTSHLLSLTDSLTPKKSF